MRVGILALLQESNTFIEGKTTLAHFAENLLCTGEEVRQRMEGSHHEIGGFFAGLAEQKIEAVPIFAARALPYGVVEAGAFAKLLEMMFAALNEAGPLNGILVAPHGATVSEEFPDVDGHWLGAVRARVGPELPIIGTLDPHGNLSPAMVAACNALVAYRTNPHLDQRQRGIEAAQLMGRTLRGEIRPTMAAMHLPMAINIERQLTSQPHCKRIYDFADAMLSEPDVLSNSIMLGFPYADVPEMGASVIVVTDGNSAEAERQAERLAQCWWDHRHDFIGQLISIDEAMERVHSLEGPICLLDMGDNVGGGSSADGTELVRALAKHHLVPAFACLYDPKSVELAQNAGIGAELTLTMGGKTDALHGAPFEARVRVTGLQEGRFDEPEARHGGIKSFDQGETAIVETADGLTLMLTSRRMVPFSLRQLTAFGIDPSRFRVLVAKGVHAPVAAYEPVCRHLIRVDTPGATSADLARLRFDHRRRPMFPFEKETEWKNGVGTS